MGASAHVGGNCQRDRQAIGQCVGACGLVCRRGAHVNRKVSHEVGALERREGPQSMRCRKTYGRGAKVAEMLGTGCSTRKLAHSEGTQRVDLTGGYCWSTPQCPKWCSHMPSLQP